MRNSLPVLAAVWVLLVSAGALAAETPPPPAEAAPPAPKAAAAAPKEAGMPVTSPENRLALRLPAPYWEALTPQEVAKQMQGGCSQGQVPASLIFFLHDKDALVDIVVTRSDRSFLMRNKDDLEAYENGVMKAIQDQVGTGASDVKSGYSERDGMTIHRYGLTITPTAHGGGCAAMTQPSGPPQKLHFLFVDYFVRPQGEDAVYYRASVRAPVETFKELQPEIDYILDSVRFTGKMAAKFFDPNAPAEKVPTAKEAAGSVTAHKSVSGWMLAVGLMIAIWLMLRWRKKPKA